MKTQRKGFTLAEVLITLAIIGVVAAMTIPTLIAKINKIVTDNQIKVFNAKIIKSMNLTMTAEDLNDTYDSTYDFLVNGLGKNLKMAKVCDKDHIRDCITYDKIKFDNNGTEKTIDVKDITTASKLKLSAPYTGDLISFNGAKIGNCSGVIDDVCFASTAVTANDAMLPLIQAVDPSYTMPKFTKNWDGKEYNDYWQLAVDYCDKVQGGKKLPDAAALLKIAKVLYNDNTLTNSYKSGLSWEANKSEIFTALGIESTASWFTLWSSQPYGTGSAYRRYFGSTGTEYSYGYGRNGDNDLAVCLGD